MCKGSTGTKTQMTPRPFPCTSVGRPRDREPHALLARKRETKTQLKKNKKNKKGSVVKIGRGGEVVKKSKTGSCGPGLQAHLCSQGAVHPWVTTPFMSLLSSFLICNTRSWMLQDAAARHRLPCWWECKPARSFCTAMW